MKKKMLSLVLCIVMILSALPLSAFTSFATVEGDWVYTYYTGYGVLLQDYTGSQTEITLPATLGAKPVKGIDEAAFQLNDRIRKVIIPEGYQSINEDAFNYCTALEEIVIPSTVTSVAARNHCFVGCDHLKEVTVWYHNQASYKALYELATKIIIPAHLRQTGSNLGSFKAVKEIAIADEGNSNFCVLDGVLFTSSMQSLLRYPPAAETTEYTVPEGVESIKANAFTGCTNLEKVVLSSTVKQLEKLSFSACYSLESIYLNKGISNIDDFAFNSIFADTLKTVFLDFDLDSFNAGNYTNVLKYVTNLYFDKDVNGNEDFGEIAAACQHAKEFIVDPENEIMCSVDGVLFNKDMTEILSYPVCKRDAVYTVPESVTKLHDLAFSCTDYLEELTIPQGVTLIPEYEFEQSYSLRSIHLPDSITEIGDGAFWYCDKLESIDIPDLVTRIGYEAFGLCTSLKSVDLPDNLEYISTGAFEKCSKLSEIELPDTLKSIGTSAFAECKSLTEIIIPEQVSKIESSAFRDCKSLKKVIISGSVGQIENLAFTGCESLESITLPKSVSKIGTKCFEGCEELKDIYIYNREFVAGDDAFLDVDPDAVVYGYADSTAPEIAAEYGLNFVAITCDHEHTDWIVTAEPTCSEAGNEQLVCRECNAILDERDIPTVEHKVKEWTAVKEPTYDETGLEELRCSVCGEVIATREIPMLIDPYPGFPDVSKEDWFYKAVRYADENGFMNGYGNGYFGPADSLQRQDFVVILARISGADLSVYTECPLTDVDMNSYYGKAVAWAVEYGIIRGYGNGKFGVGDPITREQVAVILYGYLGRPDKGSESATEGFADKDKISSFAKDAVIWAVNNGIITGRNTATLAPTDTASRAEIAAMITRMDQSGMFTE